MRHGQMPEYTGVGLLEKMKEQPRHIDLDGSGSSPEPKDLCEICQHSWIAEGSEGIYLKKCMYANSYMDRDINIMDCNRFLKEGHKGKVTHHDSDFDEWAKKTSEYVKKVKGEYTTNI